MFEQLYTAIWLECLFQKDMGGIKVLRNTDRRVWLRASRRSGYLHPALFTEEARTA